MKFPNKYLRNLKPYKLASHKIWLVTPEKRTNILKLDWNEASILLSPKVTERIRKILDEPCFFNLYLTTYNDELLTLLSRYVGLPKENLQYFGSSDALHEYICKVFISVGDPVMILGPSYDNFRLTCQANGAEVFFTYFNDDFTFDADKFEADINRVEPAVVYICNPNNPTGNVHTKLYIEHLLNQFPDTLFLLDEAYYEFSGITCKDLVLQYDNILISRTMSKAFALVNFRVGYLIGSKDNVQFVNRIRNPKNLTTFAQEAACGALEATQYMWDTQYVYKDKVMLFGLTDDSYAPHIVYGISKKMDEEYIRKSGMKCKWTIFRPCNVCGPWHMRYPNELWKFIAKGMYVHPSKKPVIRIYAYVKNLVRQLDVIMNAPDELQGRKTYYLGDMPIDSYVWLNALSKEITGKNIKRIPKFFFWAGALVGDFLRLFGINFPLYSMRYCNMIEDFFAPSNVTIALFGVFSQNYEQNVKETIDCLNGKGWEFFDYWKSRKLTTPQSEIISFHCRSDQAIKLVA